MAYDPSIPATNAEATSAMFRGQFQGLADMIAANPGITNVVIDSVTTLPAGEPATVNASLTGTVLHLAFGIPAGIDGVEGPPGEVTTQQLDDAINGTSANTNAVSVLGFAVSDPPGQSEVQMILDKLDELIMNGRR